MKVDISVGSRFHAFDLARELAGKGFLRDLHTGYPGWSARRFGLPKRALRSVWTHEPLNRLTDRMALCGWLPRIAWKPVLFERFDRIVARRLRPGADLFVGWSSQCLRSLAVARELGCRTIVERGSTHIEWQAETLREEARLTNQPVPQCDPRIVALELAEYELADAIAVPSQFAAATFIERGVPEYKLIVNPYGVDIARFRPVERPARRNPRVVLHVGQVSFRKGVHYLIEACSGLPDVQLRLVGAIHPEIRPWLDRPFIQAIGPVPGSELPQHYAAADLFALLSIEEGLAMVIAQAMASGLPVVATPNTGVEELMTDGVEGLIVPPRCPQSAGAAIQSLLDDPSRRQEMGIRARQRIESGFTWADYGQRASGHYRQLLASFH